MLTSGLLPIAAAAVAIGGLVIILTATRRSLTSSTPVLDAADKSAGKYPAGFWMSVGIAVGIAFGILLGLAVHTLVGGISIGIGVGLLLGKWLGGRFDKPTAQYTEEEELMRRRRATWGLIFMILLILATLLAALLPLFD